MAKQTLQNGDGEGITARAQTHATRGRLASKRQGGQRTADGPRPKMVP